MWLWLWHRPEATALIQPLSWEPPFSVGRQKKKKRKEIFGFPGGGIPSPWISLLTVDSVCSSKLLLPLILIPI